MSGVDKIFFCVNVDASSPHNGGYDDEVLHFTVKQHRTGDTCLRTHRRLRIQSDARADDEARL